MDSDDVSGQHELADPQEGVAKEFIIMSTIDAVLVRCQEHDYDYREWLEDVRLGYLLAVLREQDIEARVFDFAMQPLLSNEAEERAMSSIACLAPKLLVFLVDKHPTNNPFYTSRFIKKLISAFSFDESHVALYGNTVVGTEGFFADLPIDSIVLGEELEFVELADAVLNDLPLAKVPGIAYKYDGQVNINPPASLSFDLDALPFPVRYYFELPKSERHPYGYAAAMLASRGCYGRCTFCNIRAYEALYGSYPWRGRSPTSIVEEMELLYSRYGVREFSFVDPNFFGPGRKGQEHVLSFAQTLIERELPNIAFSLYARADDVTYDVFTQLKQAGLHTVFIGVESFSQSVLDRYKKGISVAQNLQAIQILKDLDIYSRIGFITFDYHTSFEELFENIQYLKIVCASKPHLLVQPIFFQNIVVPLESTPLALEYAQLGASGSDVPYEFQQRLVEHQKRRARSGNVTILGNPRIAFVSEATRRLSAMMLQRSHALEGYMARLLSQLEQLNTETERQLAAIDSWMANITPFAVEMLEYLVNSLAHASSLPDVLDQVTDEMVKACEDYDKTHLGQVIELGKDSKISVVD